jgi:hypothetical protein
MLMPKAEGSLSAIRDAAGNVVTAPADISAAVRHNRAFWLAPPEPLTPELRNVLAQYAEDAGPFPVLPIPPPDIFLESVHRSGDSATGSDGIPYAFYRLIPTLASKLLHQYLLDVSNHAPMKVPEPLLVWIPKAVAGMTADNWRPLGLPTTFIRLLSAGVYNYVHRTVLDLLLVAHIQTRFRTPTWLHSPRTKHCVVHVAVAF